MGTWVPTWVMILVVSVLTVCLFIGVPLASRAGARRGRRLARPQDFTNAKDKAKDTSLFLAALIPSVLVWLAVMGVSFIGLRGFAKDVMDWDNWTNVLVPLSLDGISVSFGAWAFVAVKRKHHPGRAYKIVLAAATVSATLNFVHGRDTYSIWAGFYLAFLSFAGMAMFHELLEQFMASYDDELALKTKNPRFGLRWFLAPISTVTTWRTWIVHPPAEGVRPSVRNALDHRAEWLKQHRAAKLQVENEVYVEQQKAQLVKATAKAETERAQAALAVPVQPVPATHAYLPAGGYPQTEYSQVPVNGNGNGIANSPYPVGHGQAGYTNGVAPNGFNMMPLDRPNGARYQEPITAQAPLPAQQQYPAPAQQYPTPAQQAPVQQRRDALTDSGEMTMTQRDLSAALDAPARSRIEQWLLAKEKVTSTRVCDWVLEESRRLNQEWRPSEAWAKLRIRETKTKLGYPASAEELVETGS